MTYVSSATKDLGVPELLELLTYVRPKNEEQGITGMLLYRGGRIIQTIEGEDEKLAAVFDSIVDDPRHRDVFVILNEPIDERQFPDWSMGFRNLTDVPEDDLAGFNPFLNDDTARVFSDSGTLPLRMLELFRASAI